MRPYFEVNDEDAIRKLTRFRLKMSKYLHMAVTESLDQVGITAVGKYMIHTRAEFSGSKVRLRGVKKGSDKLNIRTGRLARSIMKNFSYAQGGEGANEGIRSVKIVHSGIVGIIGSKVPYAAIHEFGGVIPARTAKSKTGKTYKLPPVTIPARPYLGRAIKNRSLLRTIGEIFADRIEKATKE